MTGKDLISANSDSPFDFIKLMLEEKIRYLERRLEETMEQGTSKSVELIELQEQKEKFEAALKKHLKIETPPPPQSTQSIEEKSKPPVQEELVASETKEKRLPDVVTKLSQKPLDVEIKLKELITDKEMHKIQRKILASMHGRAREMGFKDVREMLQFKRSRLLDSLLEMKKKETDEGVLNVIEKEIVAIDHLLEGNLEETLDEIEKIEKIQKVEPPKRKDLDGELSSLFSELK